MKELTTKYQTWFGRLSIIEGFFFALTVASSEAYGLYYYAKNDTSPLRIGLLTTLPLLFSAIGQLTIPKRITHERLRPAIIVLMLIQLVGLGLILSCAYHLSFWKLLIGSSLYWVGGQNASPLWMDWASEQLHVTQFPKFLARRNMIITIVGIIMFSGASFWLENLQAFKILFLIGLISRLISLFLQLYLFKKFPSTNSNLHHIDHSEQKPEFNSEMASIVKRILLPLTLFRFGVNIASPFFLPFMTHEIKLSTAT
jgi:drug/metabolite transporter (DMT)-like permease